MHASWNGTARLAHSAHQRKSTPLVFISAFGRASIGVLYIQMRPIEFHNGFREVLLGETT